MIARALTTVVRLKLVACGGAFLLCACAMSQSRSDVPARITNPSADTRAELQAAVSAALNVSSVTLADDALTASSTLVVDRIPAHDASGRQLGGRDFGRPERFDLVKNGRGCVLVQISSGKRIELALARCEPI